MNNEKRFLTDGWHSEGEGLDDFKKEIADLAAHTRFIPVLSDSQETVENDGVYHCMSYDEEAGILKALFVNGDENGKIDGRMARVSNINLDESLDSKAIMDQLLETTRLMIRFYQTTFFFSENSYFTFAQRLGLDEAMYDSSIERDIFISRLMRRSGTEWKLCVREMGEGKGKIRKVFAVFTGKYNEIPQTIISAIAEDYCKKKAVFGGGILTKWSIDHETTNAIIEFPEKAVEIRETYGISDLTPGIRIITGDTGKASLTFQAIWKKGNSYIVQDEMSLRHQGKNISKENIEEKVEDKIFPMFSKLPERLVELMELPVTDDTVPAAKYEEANKTAVTEFVKMVSKKLKLTDAVTKRNEIRIRELLDNEMDYAMHYTAYDIVMMFMDLPERLVGLNPTYHRALEKACGKVPFIKFPKVEKEELFLSA